MLHEYTPHGADSAPSHVELMRLFDSFYDLLAQGRGPAGQYKTSKHLDSVRTEVPINDEHTIIVFSTDVIDCREAHQVDSTIPPSIFAPNGLPKDDPDMPFSHYEFDHASEQVQHVGDTELTIATPISRRAIALALMSAVDTLSGQAA